MHKEHRRLRNGLDGGDRRDISAYIGVKTGSFPLEGARSFGRAPFLCSAAVPEGAGNGADIKVGRDQFGGAVVAQRVQMSVDAECGGHPRVPVRDSVGLAVPLVVGAVGENSEGVVG